MPVLSLSLASTSQLAGLATVEVRVALRSSRVAQLQRLGQNPPPLAAQTALLDTGSAYTLVDATILAALGLTTPTGQVSVHTAAGATLSCPQFNVSLTVVYPQAASRQNLVLPSVPVLSAAVGGLGVGVIIGCDVLKRCWFAYDGPAGRFVLAY